MLICDSPSTDYLDTNLTFFGSPVPVPDTANLETTNAASSLEANAGQCSTQHGQYPTFMLVDFVSVPIFTTSLCV